MKPRFLSLLAVLPLAAVSYTHAQSTWTGAAGGEWGTAANWTGGVPNATGATANINTALTVNVSDTGTGGTYPYTFGTLATSLASGSAVIGNNTVTTDILKADVTSGTPEISVATGGAIFYYANLEGTQGFNKTGGGRLTFRFNGADQTYTGDITITGGILGINQDGSLGDAENDITIATGARLLAEPGSNTGTITLPDTRIITLGGLQSQIGSNNAAVNLIVNGEVAENAPGNGLVKTDAGKVTLAGTLSYTGETRIATGTLALSGDAVLPTDQNLRFTGNAVVCTLDLGGTSQTVRTLVMDQVNANRAITGGGSLTINGDTSLTLSSNNGVTYDFSGIDSFTFDKSDRNLNFQTTNVAAVTTLNDFNLAKSGIDGGTNTITAAAFQVGGSAVSDGNNGSAARLHLGTVNIINANTVKLGAFNANGFVDFQAGLTNPGLKLRATDGISPVTTLTIGETSSGSRTGNGLLNLTGGSGDILATDILIGRHISNAFNGGDSTLTLPDGTLNATTVVMADKVGSGQPTINAVINHNGGDVTIDTILMARTTDGAQLASAGQNLRPTYNLNGGTLNVTSIQPGPLATPLAPLAQVETATAAGTASAAGNVNVTVTGAGITGSPLTIPVAVLNGDTADAWAAKVRAALSSESAITDLYSVGGTASQIVLTRLIYTLNDASLNIALANGAPSPGITAAATSGNTVTGGSSTVRNLILKGGTLINQTGADLSISGITITVSGITTTVVDSTPGQKVVLGSDVTYSARLNSFNGTSGALTVDGDLDLSASPAFAIFDDASGDATPLAPGTKLYLMDYALGSLTGTFAGQPEGSTVNVTKGAVTNSFVIKYADDGGTAVTLTVPSAGDNFDTWATDNGIPGEPFDEDFDKDGISNGVEYALGKNPVVSDTPAGVLLGNTITFTKGADAIANGDVSWTIQTSETLVAGSWIDEPSATQPAGDPSLTIAYTFGPPTPPRKFARLKVVQVP
ncbi:MAG: autotransporter-associated beta strand repeat-containing protein [Akkermansiaceae bacterium]|nr:autotransporter-associated beta strand repeat-containing protein [Akkermansiaceae bacterium]